MLQLPPEISYSAVLRKLPVLSPNVDTSIVAGDGEQGRRGSSRQSFAHCNSSHVLATMLSWEGPFIGKAHKALYATISKVCSGPDPDIYARSLAVVQSSGMGKSRMIDELSKEHFVIPINLRTTGTGMAFPPSLSKWNSLFCCTQGFPQAITKSRDF